MAWEHFPVQRGQRISAARLNELRTAASERSITVPAALFSGQSIKDVAGFLSTLRSNIEASVLGGNWWWIESYTDAVTHTIWKYTTAATNASATPKLKNIFEAAFGDSSTDWRHENESPLKADELNDIYAVLNKLTVSSHATTAASSVGRGKTSSGQSGVGPSCLAALSDVDSHAFGTELYGAPADAHSVVFVQITWTLPPEQYQSQAAEQAYAFYPTSVLPAHSVAYVYPAISTAYVAEYTQLWGEQPTGDAKRSLSLTVRAGTAGLPTTWANTLAYGAEVASMSTSAATGPKLIPRFNHSDTMGAKFVAIPGAQAEAAASSGICTVIPNGNYLSGALEYLKYAGTGTLILIERTLDKLAA